MLEEGRPKMFGSTTRVFSSGLAARKPKKPEKPVVHQASAQRIRQKKSTAPAAPVAPAAPAVEYYAQEESLEAPYQAAEQDVPCPVVKAPEKKEKEKEIPPEKTVGG